MNCPICGKDTSARYRPFCSRRCADVDLGKWLSGSYAIACDEEADRLENPEQQQDQAEKPQ